MKIKDQIKDKAKCLATRYLTDANQRVAGITALLLSLGVLVLTCANIVIMNSVQLQSYSIMCIAFGVVGFFLLPVEADKKEKFFLRAVAHLLSFPLLLAFSVRLCRATLYQEPVGTAKMILWSVCTWIFLMYSMNIARLFRHKLRGIFKNQKHSEFKVNLALLTALISFSTAIINLASKL